MARSAAALWFAPGALPPSARCLPVLEPTSVRSRWIRPSAPDCGRPGFPELSWPNGRQGTLSKAVTLLALSGAPVVQMGSADGTRRLILFPGAGHSVIGGVTMMWRHTRSLVLIYEQGSGSTSGWTEPRQRPACAFRPILRPRDGHGEQTEPTERDGLHPGHRRFLIFSMGRHFWSVNYPATCLRATPSPRSKIPAPDRVTGR